jgi:hypothetical protein
MLLSSFLEILGQVLLLNFLDDVAHLDWIVCDGVPVGLLLLHDLKHGIFMQQLKILALSVGDLLLEDVFEVFISRLGLLFTCQEFLIGLLLLDFVAPVVHPLHTVKMRAGDESCFHLDSLEFIIMLFFQQLLCTFA